VRIIVDYCTFTVPYDLRTVVQANIPLDFVRHDKGLAGYSESAFLGTRGGRVAWSPAKPEQKAYFVLPGQALAELAVSDGWDVVLFLALVIKMFKAKVTRLDIAFDDQDGVLPSVEQIKDWAAAGNLTTRWKKGKIISGVSWSEGYDAVGSTFYLGSSASDSMMRIYDKKEEREEKGIEVDSDHWIRVELQMRRDRAHALAQELVKVTDGKSGEIGASLAKIVLGYVDFKEPNESDDTKSRWVTVAWWAAFLGCVEKGRLDVEKLERTLDEVREWFVNQCTPMLAVIETAMGFDVAWSWLYNEVKAGRDRWRSHHFKLAGVT